MAADGGLPGSGGDGLVVVGWLGAVHGLRGQLRLFPQTDFPERLRSGRSVVLVPAGEGPPLATRIQSVRPGGRAWLLTVPELRSAADAQAFAGGRMCVAAADLPPLPEGRFYHHQIVGLAVVDAGGRSVGRVVEVLAAPANDVYVVRREGGGQALIPAVRAAVESIDVPGGQIRLKDLPGLLD